MISQQRWICVPVQMPFTMSLTIHSSLRWVCAHWKRGRSGLRKCLLQFPLHCNGVERIEPAHGHACESVSCDSLFAAMELRALETWSVRPATVPDCKVTDCGSHVKRVNALSLALSEQVWQPGAHVLLCSVCIIPFQLPSMMSVIDSLSTAIELSTLKTWMVRPALVYNGTDDGTQVGQPETHLLNWCVFFPRTVYRVALKSRAQCSSVLCWTSGCALSVQLSFMMFFYKSLHCAGVEHIENLGGQVCERLQSNSRRPPCETCCDQGRVAF